MAQSQLTAETILLAQNLNIGESTYAFECPKCGVAGGSFSLSRSSNGVLYHCFRAKCGFEGFISTRPSNLFAQERRGEQKPKLKSFEYETSLLTKEQANLLLSAYNILPEEILNLQWRWCPYLQRLIMPVVFNGIELGVTARRVGFLATPDGPKNIHYIHTATMPFIAGNTDGRTVYLCEDLFSLVAFERFGAAIALLGTNFSTDIAELLAGKNVVLCLDSDATEKAHFYARKYSVCFPSISVLRLHKDAKDFTVDEWEQFAIDNRIS